MKRTHAFETLPGDGIIGRCICGEQFMDIDEIVNHVNPVLDQMDEELNALTGGTKIRLPIKVVGYIELTDVRSVRVIVDKLDWDYDEWPRVSGFGDDNLIMQVDNGPDQRFLEGDVNLIDPVRKLVEFHMDGDTKWEIVAGAEDMIDGTMVP
jgi:hypothetical protein